MIRHFFISAVLLFGSLVFEKAFGLWSLVFITLFLSSLVTGRKILPLFILAVGILKDALFFRPLGATALIYATAFILWEGSKSLTRWRFPFFLLIGFGVTTVFFVLDAVPFTLPAFLREGIVLVGGWLALRFFSTSKHAHIRLSLIHDDADV